MASEGRELDLAELAVKAGALRGGAAVAPPADPASTRQELAPWPPQGAREPRGARPEPALRPHAAERGGPTPTELALLRGLVERPGSVPLVAVLEWLWRLFPATTERYGDEPVQIGHSPSLGFDPGELAALELHGEPPRGATLTASLFGLCGSASMLPHYLVEEAARDDERGAAVRGLLDVIHHRLLTWLVRGLRLIDLASTLRSDGRDPWSRRLLDLLGQRASEGSAIPPALTLRLAPVLASGVRSPAMLTAALRTLVGDQLGQAQLRVEAFAGSWMAIDASQWSRLGEPSARLGDTAIAGTEVFHPAGAAQIVIGPLRGDHYQIFTPGHLGHARIAALTESFSPDPLRYDLILEIEDMAYPPGLLGQRHLGKDLWLARSDRKGVSTRMPVPVHHLPA